MKAISVRNPWAWAIAHGGKRVENREWQYPPTYRGPLLIHASKWHSDAAIVDTMDSIRHLLPPSAGKPLTLRMFKEQLRGVIVARAELVAVTWNHASGHSFDVLTNACRWCGTSSVAEFVKVCAKPDPWAVPDQFGFILADVVPLDVPVPWKGGLSFFDVPESMVKS